MSKWDVLFSNLAVIEKVIAKYEVKPSQDPSKR